MTSFDMMAFGIMTFGIITFGIMALGIMIFGIRYENICGILIFYIISFGILKFSIMTFGIITLFICSNHRDKTRVQMPAKNISSIEIKMSAVYGPPLLVLTQSKETVFSIKFGVLFTIKTRF
jgi:hypothetical protein